MILRAARPEDAAAVCAIANPIIRDTLITFTTRERMAQDVARQIAERGAAFLVAERGGAVAGFATYGPFRSGPGYAASREHTVQLVPEARGRGLGRALMARLEAVASGEGIHVLIAGISAANPAAIAFHAALGYAEVGRMPEVGRKQGRWLDLVLMQKILAAGRHAAPDSAPGPG
ncbi:MAG: N-acetyltransferase [Sedimentitalea sp.]|nr:N-acetyltransferase [Sedimentitalea sp.]